MKYEVSRDNLLISTDPAHLDPAAIFSYLSRSYWAANRPFEVVERTLQNSLCFGVYDGSRQIGLARLITDRETFVYLCDVYILEEYQGRGLGKWLIETVTSCPDLQHVRRWSLATRDAHGLYAQYGFTPLENQDRWMERFNPDR